MCVVVTKITYWLENTAANSKVSIFKAIDKLFELNSILRAEIAHHVSSSGEVFVSQASGYQ